MDNQFIIIRKAKEHNLKSIDLDIPRDKLVVITGLSGSGKSSLAFDTIYAEGQRRYVESLSSYARQFLDQLQKPDIEHIEGLSPCIAIEQRTAGGSPRSTVCTQTEIYDYLRLLFARIGKVHCYKCKGEIKNQSAQEIVEQLLSISQDSIIDILAPIVKGKKGEYRDIFSQIKKSGFVRARVDNKFYELNEEIKLDKYKIHHIEVAIDKLTISQDIRNRLTDSVETALKIGSGVIKVILYSKKNKSSPENLKLSNKKVAKELIFSENYACPKCGISYAEVEPRIFSFNSPYGACTVCNGLGTKPEFDLDLIIPDRNKSINEGALLPWRRGPRGYLMYYSALLKEFSRAAGFDLDVPFNKLAKHIQKEILFGSDLFIWGKPYEGLVPHLERLFKETKSDYLKQEITRFMSTSVCPECNGSRLKKESLFVLINGMNIFQLTQMSINEAKIFFDSLVLNKTEYAIAENILKEINRRLQFCIDVGLDYLTLDRKSQTLSGGESQRIRLATQVG